ncbi:MAG: Rid family detoxifying hydrolase [Actinomycetota bacterium]|nr:Rid family detoxifying hydrolase [Actinomycetota bacterium]
MAKEVVASKSAPAAVGAYSQAIVANGFVFCSGQIALDPGTNELIQGTIADETRRCLENLQAVLAEAGVGFEHVVKVTAYLADIEDFGEFNEAYALFAGSSPPARAAFAVKDLPKGARVEIECVAAL